MVFDAGGPLLYLILYSMYLLPIALIVLVIALIVAAIKLIKFANSNRIEMKKIKGLRAQKIPELHEQAQNEGKEHEEN